MGSDDQLDEHFPCSVCGEDVMGAEFLCVDSWQFFAAGEPGDQVYLTCEEMDAGESAEYLHSHCVAIYAEMQFAAARRAAESEQADGGD